jgi:hypothetical protein
MAQSNPLRLVPHHCPHVRFGGRVQNGSPLIRTGSVEELRIGVTDALSRSIWGFLAAPYSKAAPELL